MIDKKVNNTRVISVKFKIVLVFSILILLSNLSSNYTNLIFNRSELLKLMNQLLTKDLKSIYSFSNNQYHIYEFDKKLENALQSIERKGLHEMKNKNAVVLGVKPGGEILFQASQIKKHKMFEDTESLKEMNKKLKEGEEGNEGHIYFDFNNESYFGIYKYNANWDVFILRAEEINDFYRRSRTIFRNISIMIIGFTIIIAVIGIFLLRFILRYIDIMTKSIMRMVRSQELELINMDGATNDDITYLGIAFNSLSSTIDNLIGIFRKFANKDVVVKAYKEREVKLEGTKEDLTILFTDIKSFTFITETLGNDIIKLLNMHYDRAIREIDNLDGVIGAIIGDALLAVFGAVEDSPGNKSYQSVMAAYKVHEVTESLKNRMIRTKEKMEKSKGKFTKEENAVFKAVLLEVGVGIDGGEVFYGTLGSYVRMTSTVIGDTVNAASRLEGLTRFYKVPIICSEYIKNDIEENIDDHGIYFLELDTVLVKGKTKGKKIYWALKEDDIDDKMKKNISAFKSGLALYYEGDWKTANKKFKRCSLPVAKIFKERTSGSCPRNWNGVWQMETK
jgi:adenylate cyclase